MGTSNNSLNNYSSEFTHPHTHQMLRKPNIRRSDTLDVYNTGAYEIRKANSFNSNDSRISTDDTILSRRTNSMRHPSASAFSYEMIDDIETLPPPAPILTDTSNNRRNCRMHKSFHERSRQHDVKKEKVIDVKCYSLGDDGSDDNLNISNKRRLSPKFNSAESSLDNEVFHSHSRSSSRNKMESSAETIDAIETTSPTTSVAKKSVASVSHKHSSQSLDKPHHNFKRIARATQSFYLNPSQLDELRLHRSMHGQSASMAKRMHSASMRSKPFRETLSETKKSKSFVADPFMGNDLSPHRRDSVSEIKKSPRLSSGGHDSQKSSNFDGNNLEYDITMRGRYIFFSSFIMCVF